MTRFIIPDDQISDAEAALDDAFIDYDYDEGGRIMVTDDDLEAAKEVLDQAGISYDEI